MSDRLSDLQRQRALLQEHLAWLDREIARESAMTADKSAGIPTAPIAIQGLHSPQAGFGDASRPVPAQSAADILASYKQEKAGSMAQDAKRGCMLYFIFAMVSLLMLAGGAYLIYINTHSAP